MTLARVSVIIPTRNRSESLRQTIRCLRAQELTRSQYEIVVVDDGSTPPVSKSLNEELADCSLVRLEGVERSAARNRGAAVATGDVLLFVDDDMTVGADFLTAHLGAHKEWPEAIVVGAIRLPDESLATPLGRFRQNLEQRTTPAVRGLTSTRNFCTAANMSISRELFLGLGGFDVSLSSSEDQDLALRHTAGGGLIAFLPEAEAIHNDNALDIGSYCRRAEWGSENMIAFCQRHPHWPDNIERERINGPVIWGLEPIAQSARKLIKSLLAARLIIAIMLAAASVLERSAPRNGGRVLV